MSEKSYVLILLGGVLMNNYALQHFLGVSSFLGNAKSAAKAASMGAAVTIVMVLSALVTWPVQTLVLDKFGLGYLQTLVFMAIILALVYLVDAVVRKTARKSLGVSFPLIALNSAVLSLTINSAAEGLSFPQALVYALGVGLGFLLAMVVFAGVQTKIEEQFVPKAFRGLPVSLMATAILSLALFAF